MVRSGPWDAHAAITDWAAVTLRSLPPPPDGVLYLLGDSTRKPKRGRKHPLGHLSRHGEQDAYQFGFARVLLMASGERLRSAVAVGRIEAQGRGHQHRLWRQR